MKRVYWAFGAVAYAVFMIGYFLVLTLFLPSFAASPPGWVEAGVYAEYRVGEYVADNLVENGTYTWRIVSTSVEADGTLIVMINETYVLGWKEDWWNSTWVDGIPSAGKILSIRATEGIVGHVPLWFNRYYNDFLIDLSVFEIGNGTFEGVGFKTVVIGGEAKPAVGLTLRFCTSPSIRIPPYYETYNYWFDRETGLLLKYSYGFRDRWTRVILEDTNVEGESYSSKVMADMLLVSPLFVVPIVGATVGLLKVKRNKYRFSLGFWLSFIILNGAVLASVANWPLRAPLGRLIMLWLYVPEYLGSSPALRMMVWNFMFWAGLLTLLILLIDHYAIPLISKPQKVEGRSHRFPKAIT